jgi:hypothetical protein
VKQEPPPMGRDSHRQLMAEPLAGMSGMAGKLPGAKPSPRQGPKMPMWSGKNKPAQSPIGRGATRDKNPIQERVKTLSPYEAGKGARGGAEPGGGISSDRRTKRMSKDEATAEAAQKVADPRGSGEVGNPRHNSPYDSNPPAPGDNGTGNYNTSCFV